MPDGDYPAFLERFRDEELRAWVIVDQRAGCSASTRASRRFTIGQRKGVGISAPGKLYVLSKDPATARIVVGPNERLGSSRLWAGEANWLSGSVPEAPFRARRPSSCHHGIPHDVLVSPPGPGGSLWWRATSPSAPSRPASRAWSTMVTGSSWAA